MVNVFYNTAEAEKFANVKIKNGGTAEIRAPFGEKDNYREVVWTHDMNTEIVQIVFGHPNHWKVIEEFNRDDFDTQREFDRTVYQSYSKHIHELEPDAYGKKVYQNRW